ncbi:putative thioredoxin [Hamiltosporidium tvaerminnensis]|uniref:Putative thioredoxin n=1 Tax=Hamiltosporidium tvaerminnensis TaxID=1176355 RepID=A0A4Q9L8W2_9MICR|nr:hypothetical protein LUQ84_002263 [Hamiltosporidium tvaerminnensis]TBU03190.1 putative thioredoxin [Hamiltosporidium tvaerminnensis]
MLLFIHFYSILSEILETCTLPENAPTNIVLKKFYRETCPHCQRLAPLIEEIGVRLERSNTPITIQSVDCGKCECSKEEIDAVPQLILYKNNEEVGRMKGYKEFDEIVTFLTQNTDINPKIFKHRIKKHPGQVVRLRERDFYTGFDGPWVILFYTSKDSHLREILSEVSKIYSEKLNVGEIPSSETQNLTHRFNIQSYPVLLILYNGINMVYNHKMDLPTLSDYVDELLEPSFKELTLDAFNTTIKNRKIGDPIFIVFNTNLSLANSYFRQAAHEYKMKAKIYKTSDPDLFQKANIFPKKEIENTNETKEIEHVKDEDMVILAVYRNGIFHQCPEKLSNGYKISEWIFHAHFPHITIINNDNFFTIFHGLKPAVILLTREEELVDQFEKLSANRHIGLPFSEKVYGVINVDDYPLFIPSLVPNLPVPSVFIYNPFKQYFYAQRILLNENNFNDFVEELIEKYDENKLKPYPPKKSYIMSYLMVLGVIIGIGLLLLKKGVATKKSD